MAVQPSLQEAEPGLAGRGEATGCWEAAERRHGVGGLRPKLGHICALEQTRSIRRLSGSRGMAVALANWLPEWVSSGTHSTLRSSQATGWQPCARIYHLTLHHASPPSSSHQQIQLTDDVLQLQKAKQLWKTEQVPWNSRSQRGRGGLRADSGVGGGGRTVQANAGQPSCTRGPQSTAPPNADAPAHSVLWAGAWASRLKSPHNITCRRG